MGDNPLYSTMLLNAIHASSRFIATAVSIPHIPGLLDEMAY